MIVLDYELSAEWSRKTGELDLRAADETTLQYDCFLGDVVMVVDGLDLSTRWGWVPVLDFALALRWIAGALASGGEEVFEFTESDATITFRRRGDSVEIGASYVRGAAAVGYVGFLLEAERFLRRVVDSLGSAYPALRENPLVADLERRPSRRVSRDELVALVRLIQAAEGRSQEEADGLVDLFEAQVRHPEAGDLIFQPDRHFGHEPTAEEVVDRALSYRPVEL